MFCDPSDVPGSVPPSVPPVSAVPLVSLLELVVVTGFDVVLTSSVGAFVEGPKTRSASEN